MLIWHEGMSFHSILGDDGQSDDASTRAVPSNSKTDSWNYRTKLLSIIVKTPENIPMSFVTKWKFWND